MSSWANLRLRNVSMTTDDFFCLHFYGLCLPASRLDFFALTSQDSKAKLGRSVGLITLEEAAIWLHPLQETGDTLLPSHRIRLTTSQSLTKLLSTSNELNVTRLKRFKWTETQNKLLWAKKKVGERRAEIKWTGREKKETKIKQSNEFAVRMGKKEKATETTAVKSAWFAEQTRHTHKRALVRRISPKSNKPKFCFSFPGNEKKK